MSSIPILTVSLEHERDVVLARQRSRQLATLLGFDIHEQTRIATAVSEIARNALRFARGGRVDFVIEGRTSPQLLTMRVSDRGPGIAMLDRVIEGGNRSAVRPGLGISGARRLMDGFDIQSSERGTTVELKKILPRGTPQVTPVEAARMAEALGRATPEDAFGEVQRQNQELLATLEELRQRQEELIRLNRELEDTNRGVVALYAELDEKADHLRRADELKSRFLSNMSHEFRTPLNSVLALSSLLLGRTDGDLSPEQEKQVGYIHSAAQDLAELVNDLLDLAKVEAGKIVVRPAPFQVAELFGALRGMLRPLLTGSSVDLVFVEPEGLPVLETDEAKVSQILRNFISNALKFTERGDIRVWAELVDDGRNMSFSVSDTGIGIAPEDQERIFEQFTQVDSALQRRVRGTGLGLPLTRKLAGLLGGSVRVKSEVGRGSTFTATLPIRFDEEPDQAVSAPEPEMRHSGIPILIVEDSPEDVLLYGKYLKDSLYDPIIVGTLPQARQVIERVRPRAVILDILLRGTDCWSFIPELRNNQATQDLPILVVSTVDDEPKAAALGANVYSAKPVSRRWLVDQLDCFCAPAREPVEVPVLIPGLAPLLIVENSPETIRVYEQYLEGSGYQVIAARSIREAEELLVAVEPAAVVLEIFLPGEEAWDFLARIKADPLRRHTPVLVVTVLDEKRRGFALGADDYCVKPIERGWLLEKLHLLSGGNGAKTVLVIDDDETTRYLVRTALGGTPFRLIEAADGPTGLWQAEESHPGAIILDLTMPGMSGFEVLHRLKANPATASIPVIIHTANVLSEEDKDRLLAGARAVIQKSPASHEEAVRHVREALPPRTR